MNTVSIIGIAFVFVFGIIFGVPFIDEYESFNCITTPCEMPKITIAEKIGQSSVSDPPEPIQDCSGTARCITGMVTKVTDGDTINVYNQAIRFALSSAPELDEPNGPEARSFIDEICPVGSLATVDEDDGQTEGSYGRVLGVIYCNGVNLNSELLDSGLGYLSSGFCDSSEFASHSWAIKHGC